MFQFSNSQFQGVTLIVDRSIHVLRNCI